MKKSITAGIDFGNQTSVLSIPTEKGIEIISNESSNRRTPTMVGYQDERRTSGEFAQQQQMMNITNTITQLKRLVGLRYGSQEQKNLSDEVSFKIVCLNDNACGIQLENGETLRVEQIIGYYLKSLLNIIQKKNPNIEQIVLTVPPSWTEIQRHSIIDAATIANVKIVELLDSSLASAISYVKIHSDRFPDEHAKALNVLFIELGDTSMNSSIATLSKNTIEMKSNFCDDSIGGHFITEILEKYLIQKVIEKYKIDPQTNKRSLIRFKQACEKAKRTLSSNPVVLFEVPSLMNDIDISITIKREEFNELIKHYNSNIKSNIERAIKESGIDVKDISYVEIIGGCSRIPLFKEAIKETIGGEVKMSLDLDECFAIGAGYFAAKYDGANIGLNFVTDLCPYEIGIRAEKVKESVTIFNKKMKIPLISKAWIPIIKSQKLILLCDKGDIGTLSIKTGLNHKQNVQILIKMDKFGIVDIEDATYKVKNIETNKIERKRCSSVNYTPFRSLSQQEIEQFKQIEEESALKDKIEIDIDNAKNELESLIFSTQNEIKSIKVDDPQIVDKFNQIQQWFSDNEFERLGLNEYKSKIVELNQIKNCLNHQKDDVKINKKNYDVKSKSNKNRNNEVRKNSSNKNKENEIPEEVKQQIDEERRRKHQRENERRDQFDELFEDPFGFNSNPQRQHRTRNNARQRRGQDPRDFGFPFGF